MTKTKTKIKPKLKALDVARIHAEVRVRGRANKPLLHFDTPLEVGAIRAHHSDREKRQLAVNMLRERGFEITHVGRLSISVVGTRDVYKRAFGSDLLFDEDGQHWGSPEDDSTRITPNRHWADLIESVVLHRRHERCSLSPTPPAYPFYHLDPEGLLAHLNVIKAHELGYRGDGVHIAIVDTGFFDHAYFWTRDLSANVVLSPDTSHPEVDEVGHGTMVASNSLTIAPAARVTLVKENDEAILLSFKIAVDLAPEIIQNTWGFEKVAGPLTAFERLVVATVLDAIERGITVVFAGGNGNFLLTAQIPEVIAAGGVFVDAEEQRQAASYASGYVSEVFDGRNVPDFCGLVGMKPNGVYLSLPTQPDSEIDVAFAKPYPDGDGGSPSDGWVVISGTSAGSAQISGICALLKQADPTLTPERMKSILAATTWPVLMGESSQGAPAGPGVPSVAVGYGLVNAWEAVRLAIETRGPTQGR